MRHLLAASWLALMVIAACSPPTEPPIVAIRVLEPWMAYSDVAAAGEPAHAWQFVVAEPGPIRVRVQTDADLQVTLKAADGALLAAGRDMSVLLPAAGVYSVEVQVTSGAGGIYSIEVSYSDRTPVPSSTPTPTAIPSLTPTMPPTITSSYTPSRTPTPTLTFTPSQTYTATLTPSATFTSSATYTPSTTFTPSLTPTAVWATLGSLIGTLVPGVETEGVLISAFDRHIYALEVDAGAFITVHAAAIGAEFDPAITLYDPRGMAIAFDDDSGGAGAARILNVRAAEGAGGTYFVQVGGAALSAGATGGYRLRAEVGAPTAAAGQPDELAEQSAPRPMNQPIPAVSDGLTPGQPVIDQLVSAGAVRRFLIETGGGAIITVAARAGTGSGVIPRIEVVNPGGDLMLAASGTSAVPAIIPGLALLEAGTYSVYVTSAAGAGDVIVGYDFGEAYVATFLGDAPPDRVISGALALPGSRDVYTMPLSAGDVIDLEIGAAGGLTLALNGPDGTRLAQTDGRISGLTIGANGMYAVSIFAADGSRISAYQWAWRRVIAGSTPTPTPERIPLLTTDDVLSAQAYRYYPFFAQAGQTVRVRVSGVPPVDPVVAVLAADGSVIAEGDDSADGLNPDLRFVIPQDGTYTLRASAYNSAGGAVTIRVELEG